MVVKTLVKLDVMSIAKIYAVGGAIVGFVMGVLVAGIGLVASPFVSSLGAGFAVGIGLLSIIILPALYALTGFVGGAIGAFLYNVIARLVGGVKMEFDK